MKKKINMVVFLAMAVILAACGADERKNRVEPTEEKLKIGVVQISDHPSLDEICQSFLEEMAAQGYGENKVEYMVESAQDDVTNLNTICKKFVGDNADMIVAIATPTAQTAAAAAGKIPVVFSAVTDPVAAKLVKEPQQPEGTVTGTSDAIPVERVLRLCKELTPQVKKIGLLYTASEINSQVTVEQAKKLAPQFGLEFEVMAISENSELQQAAQALAGRTDAIYVPIDNAIASAMSILTNIGREQKIPVYVGADSMVQDGGFATVGIEYSALGKRTAQMAKKILEGVPVSQVPVETLEEFSTYINRDTAEALGIELPGEILKTAVILTDEDQ